MPEILTARAELSALMAMLKSGEIDQTDFDRRFQVIALRSKQGINPIKKIEGTGQTGNTGPINPDGSGNQSVDR